MLVDSMTFRGHLMAVTRHGINRVDTGPLMRCSFEETVEILVQAAAMGEHDGLRGVSENIMMGNLAPCGTGAFELVLDEEMVRGTMPGQALADVENYAALNNFGPGTPMWLDGGAAGGMGGRGSVSPQPFARASLDGRLMSPQSPLLAQPQFSPIIAPNTPLYNSAGGTTPGYGAGGSMTPRYSSVTPRYTSSSPSSYSPTSPTYSCVFSVDLPLWRFHFDFNFACLCFLCVKSDLTGLFADLAGLQSDFASVQSDFAGLFAHIASVLTDFSGLLAHIASLQPDFAGLQSHQPGIFTNEPGLQPNVTCLQVLHWYNDF
jgi:hypothetical protein